MLNSTTMINVTITEQGVFTRAEKFWLNGVLGNPGPAPNKRREKAQNAEDSAEGLENAGAQYLKKQIETGGFLLISSDMELNN